MGPESSSARETVREDTLWAEEEFVATASAILDDMEEERRRETVSASR